MKKLPDNCIDFIYSDFPYNISNNGSLTMNSFAGGGTTGLASFKKNRNYISIEKESGFIQNYQR